MHTGWQIQNGEGCLNPLSFNNQIQTKEFKYKLQKETNSDFQTTHSTEIDWIFLLFSVLIVLLVILDLNGTILETSFRKKQGVSEDFKTRTKYIYLRPYLKEFFTELIQHPNITLAIWTSCAEENAKEIVDQICAKYSIESSVFEFIFSRRQCKLLPNYKSIKDLQFVWDTFPQWDKHNTIILDDTKEKVRYHENNLILVNPFDAKNAKNDNELLCILKKIIN